MMATSTTTVIGVATIIFFVLLITTTTAAPILGLDSFLAQQSRIDPQASNDSFLSLPSFIRKSLSVSHPRIPSLITSLLSLSLSLAVNVRLIGDFPSDSSSLLSSFLTASQPSNHFHVITPFINQNHHLSLKHSLHLDVSHSPSLASKLSDAIKSEIARTPSSLRTPLLSIPYNSVDQIVKHDFEKEKPVEGVYIYLLNLGPQSKPYAYNYGKGDSSAAFTKCVGSFWTGKERYVWIDLGAGPVDYGPALSGDGVLPRGEFHPLAALHGRPKSQKALLADLASLIWSAYQSLNFRTYGLQYEVCPICSFAISRSLNSYTSRFLFDNYTLIASEYLDSKRLHQILSDSAGEFRKAAGVPEEDFGRILPVYVFDLDYSQLLLLDRYHQSVAFKDMVIAVRTKNTQTVSDYNCNGRYVFTQMRELERPLVGSILQSMWGVSPTHLSWSPRHNDTFVDYTWSIGQTPFGPFSEISTLSFVQKDAARRNVLLTSLNYSISSAIDVLESIETHGGHSNLLKRNQRVEFMQRWNLFKYKLDKVVSAMSHLDFEMALFYLRSSDHDLYGIHSIIYHASQEIEASLVCFRDPPFPWASVSVSALGFLALLYVYAKRDKLFRNKRKQF
ncbi:Transmembrane protein [Quillaja saponaria]|uniref:Transmembrane protein n=1 Tax=Quillaja saponaria TaxID=32244 RepID=A0AAD7Q485_QUISA|nr:Transmembrane protein [Quillaja saponaria]